MRAEPVLHPTDETLAAYGLGKVNDTTAASVLQHLEVCPGCRKRVAELPPDSFLGRLRCVGVSERTPEPQQPLTAPAHTVFRKAGESAAPAGTEPVPPALARNPDYQVVRKLGEGGMGVVYLVRNVLMDRLEVIKVMNKDSIDRPGAVERFLREIRAAAQLSHPNVVRAYAATRVDDVLTFAMEFVDGDDLVRVVEKSGPLPVASASNYIQQAALGLQHAHEHEMVHRDIKPANLILARVGKRQVVKILDFGLAKATSEAAADAGLTGVNQIMGTPLYMAPEQARSAAKADIRADIYSLGCTLYHLLAGRPPFVAQSVFDVLLSHREHTARPLNGIRADVPIELSMVVAKMLAKDPAHRFQTPGEVAAALVPFVKPEGIPVSAPPDKSAVAPCPAPRAVSRAAEPAVPRVVAPAVPRAAALRDSDTRPAAPVPPAPACRSGRSRRLWATAVGAVVFALVALWAGGALRVKTKHGTIVVENVPADAEVEVDGERVTLTRNDEAVTVSAVKEGTHKLKIVKGGVEVWATDVTVKVGGETVRVRMEVAPRPIPPVPKPVPKEEFVSLFNGKDLTGWFVETPQHKDQWDAVDGVITAKGTGGVEDARCWLLTEAEYANFILRFQYRLTTENAGSQVGYRCLKGETAVNKKGRAIPFHPNCLLIAETPGTDWRPNILRAVQEDVLSDVRDVTKPVGEWNDVELHLSGPRLRVTINDRQVHDRDLPTIAAGTKPPSIPGYKRAKGHVGFLSVTRDATQFRDIRIKELPATDGAPAKLEEPTVRYLLKLSIDNQPFGDHRCMSDGTIRGVRGAILGEWSLANEGRSLTLRWMRTDSRGNRYTDNLNSTGEGNFAGTNNDGTSIRGILSNP